VQIQRQAAVTDGSPLTPCRTASSNQHNMFPLCSVPVTMPRVTSGPPNSLLRLAATFVCYVCAVSLRLQCTLFATPIIVIFPRAARKIAHNNGCGCLPYKGRTGMVHGVDTVPLNIAFTHKHNMHFMRISQLTFSRRIFFF